MAEDFGEPRRTLQHDAQVWTITPFRKLLVEHDPIGAYVVAERFE